MSPPGRDPSSLPIPAWRIVLGTGVLAVLAVIAAALAPVYYRNLQLEKALREVPPTSDDAVKQAVIQKGRLLDLEIPPDHLQVKHFADTGRTGVQYVVRVNISLYTVDLHFSSMVGSGAAEYP